jgi:hypothetical protein
MKASKKNVVRKRPGRPATGQDPVTAIRLSKEMRAAVDAWATSEADKPVRSEAIRRLLEIGLTVGAKQEQTTAATADRAKELASKAIDSLTAGAPNSDEKANRKRRLIKGPEEFREVRVDRPKGKS